MNGLARRMASVTPARIDAIQTGGRRVHRGIGIVAFPLLFAVGGWLAWRDLQPLLFWRATDAIVQQADVERVRVSNTARTRGPAWRWRPRVQYRWVHDRQAYVGDRFSPTETAYRNPRDAWRVAKRYTGTQHVTAWMNPKAPEEAVLSRRPSFIPYLFLLVAGGLFAFMNFVLDPRERKWKASGPGWSAEAHMPGTPAPSPGSDSRPIE